MQSLKKREQELQEVHMRASMMDKELLQDMRQQQLLITQMQLAHKRGDVQMAKRIEARLQPDEV